MRNPTAGKRNKRVIFQTRSTTQDTVGGQVATWTDLVTVWAMLEPSFGKELLTAQAMNIDQPMTICTAWQTIFADPKQVAAMRVTFKGRIFDIKTSYNLNEANRFLVAIASEGMTNG